MAGNLLGSPGSTSSQSWNDHSFSDSKNYSMNEIDYGNTGIKDALKDLLKLSIPITLTSLFVSFLLFANLVWIGHHSTTHELAGAALGNMIVNVMGNSLIIGMTSGLDTQCGQAYGAKLFKYMGVLLQRSILVSHIVLLIITILFWFSGDILKILGQQSDDAHNAGIFIKIFIICLWPIAMFSNLRRFLQAQSQVIFIPVAVIIGLIVQIIALLILVNALNLGFIGACYALPCTYWSMAASLFFFTKCNKKLKKAVSSTWPGWGKWALKDWKIFIKLSIAGTFQLCLEWWALEVGAIFAGYMGDSNERTNNVSGFTVCINCLGLFARVPLGISFASAVLVGNKLGGQKPQSAKIIYDLSVALSMIFGVLFSAWMILFPSSLANFYTKNEQVRYVVKDALPYVGVYFLFYAYQRAAAGGVRGMGRQKYGAIFYFIGYYLIGMPFGIYCAFKGFFGDGIPMHLKGLWLGAAVSSAIGASLFFCFRLCVNWDLEVDRAQQRIKLEQEKLKEFKEKVNKKYGTAFEQDNIAINDTALLDDVNDVNIGEAINNNNKPSISNIKFNDNEYHSKGDVMDEDEIDFDDKHDIKPNNISPQLYSKGGIQSLNKTSQYIANTNSMSSTKKDIQTYINNNNNNNHNNNINNINGNNRLSVNEPSMPVDNYRSGSINSTLISRDMSNSMSLNNNNNNDNSDQQN